MKKNYEMELPKGYVAVKTIDAKKPMIAIIFNLLAIAIFVIFVMIAYMIFQPQNIWQQLIESINDLRYWIFLLMIIIYMILHELLHGLAYKLLTKQKLTFGLTLSVAYCGVPHIYTYRRTSLIALLTPFVVFTILLTIPLFILKCDIDIIYCSMLLGLHIGGCIGDLYDACLLFFQYRDPLTLINDNGPMQVIYVPSNIIK